MQQRRESPEIVSLPEAVDRGLRWYFTGLPCPKGHVAKRSVSNRECRSCVNERAKAKRASGGCVELDKRRYSKDIERNREKGRCNRKKHAEARRLYDKKRYYSDPERMAQQKRQASEWAKSNPGKRNHIIAKRRSWIKKATPPWVTQEMMEQIRATYMMARDLGGMHVDHIHPLRAKNSCGLHVPWNLQIIPAIQNIKKGNRYET